MKKLGLISVIILLIGVIAMYSFFKTPQPSVQLIQLKGATEIMSFPKNVDMYKIQMSADSIVSFPMIGNEVVFGSSDNDQEFIFRIKNKENKLLKFTSDSLGTYLDGHLICIVVSDENGSADWLNASSPEDISYLQTVAVRDSISDKCLQSLQKLAKSSSDLGLIIDNKSKYSSEIIRLVNPVWLATFSDTMDSNFYNELYKLKKLEMLNTYDSQLDMAKLGQLSNFRSLHLGSLDSMAVTKLGQLPQNITAFTVSDSKIKDLRFLERSTQLTELTLNGCDGISNLEPIMNLTHLQSLSLMKCDSIADLSPLSGLKELKWLAPPWNINEEQLASIVKNSPDLESLVLFDCKHLKSLHALKDLHQLNYLSLIKTPLVPDSLTGFKNLKYLAYDSNEKSDSLNILRLQKQMPHTLVVPVEPFCMGTGWLLLFFGLLMIVAVVSIGVKKKWNI